MSLAFVPLYIRLLGIEAYGLIGMFAVLQSCLALLDGGTRPALAREMARFTAGARSAESTRDLLRSVEIVCAALSLGIAIGIWFAAGWLASEWVSARNLSANVVSKAFVAMGIVISLRFVENIYVSSLVGLQRQVLESVVGATMASARSIGAIAILMWVSPTIGAFFYWQGLVSLLTVPLLAVIVYKTLPSCATRPQFSWSALIQIRRFAAGIFAITSLALLLTQIDKILLSRLLPLSIFGYYALAGVVVNTLYMLTGPIGAAFYPKFTELVARNDQIALTRAYHFAAQLVTVIMGGAGIMLIAFGERIVALWTANPVLAHQVAPLVQVMAIGTLINGLIGIPYQIQLAHGWTALTIRINIVAVALLVPAIYLVVPAYGAIGAAWVWVTLNTGYLAFDIYFMHRRLLRHDMVRWYWRDVTVPLIAAAAVAEIFHRAIPQSSGRVAESCILLASAGGVAAAGALSAPAVRSEVTRLILEKIRLVNSMFAWRWGNR
jgi:O-antigen/teichoic acid export membrane protein